jgi:hypothetical protein
MVNTQGAADLREQFTQLSTAEREALAAKASGERPAKPKVHAFGVVVMPGGAALALQDISKLDDYDHSPASVEEIFNASNVIVSDLHASKTAQVLMMSMNQQAQAMMNASENQRVMEELRKAGAI